MKDWKRYLRQLRGTTVSFDLTGYRESLDHIARLEPASQALSDEAILQRSRSLRERARGDEARDHIRHELFALAREAAHRALRQRAFDEQILAALALDDGCVVEMLTGEGKTLTAVMAAAMGALSDRGVHVLTFNDYLAARDAEWMGPVYRRLGLSVGCVQQGMTPAARRAAYLADVTYVTAKEAGFDHLRDRLVMEPGDLVHRPFHLALVDEADSIMIDEARVPLVIAGSVEGEVSLAPRLAALVAALVPGQHFDSDEYGRDVELTDAGIEHVERQLGCGSLHDAAQPAPAHGAQLCAARANAPAARRRLHRPRTGASKSSTSSPGASYPIATGQMACRRRSKPRKAWSVAATDRSSAHSPCRAFFAVTRGCAA